MTFIVTLWAQVQPQWGTLWPPPAAVCAPQPLLSFSGETEAGSAWVGGQQSVAYSEPSLEWHKIRSHIQRRDLRPSEHSDIGVSKGRGRASCSPLRQPMQGGKLRPRHQAGRAPSTQVRALPVGRCLRATPGRRPRVKEQRGGHWGGQVASCPPPPPPAALQTAGSSAARPRGRLRGKPQK